MTGQGDKRGRSLDVVSDVSGKSGWQCQADDGEHRLRSRFGEEEA